MPVQVTWKKNAKLGRFTNFVNLLDMCGVAVPSAIYTHPKLDPEALHGEPCRCCACHHGHALNALRAWPCSCCLLPHTVAALAAGEAKQRGEYLAASGNPTPKLPFGVTFIANSWLDEWLWGLAERYHDVTGLGCGPHEHSKADQSAATSL